MPTATRTPEWLAAYVFGLTYTKLSAQDRVTEVLAVQPTIDQLEDVGLLLSSWQCGDTRRVDDSLRLVRAARRALIATLAASPVVADDGWVTERGLV